MFHNQKFNRQKKILLFLYRMAALLDHMKKMEIMLLAKKIDSKVLPDTIKCRHILIGTVNPQTQQPLMDDTTAHRIADSIATAIKNGASFDSLDQKYSTDETAKQQNGVMTFDLQTIESDNFAKPFADFLLNDKGETKKVVKTQFGWHYIEILDKKDYQPSYKIALWQKKLHQAMKL